MSMIFDTHAHYNSEQYNYDVADILNGFRHIELLLNVGCDLKSSRESISLAERFSFVYASVGIHPHEVQNMTDHDIEILSKLCEHPKVRAIGEIGLDYHYEFSDKNKQKKWFTEQISMASALDLPVIIHDRDAHCDCLEIVKKHRVCTGVFHCYSGNVEMARELLSLGYHLSFTGAITFKNAKKALEVIRFMPLDRIMIETDAPYLTPEPYRGKRNNSDYLIHVADKIAEIKGLTTDEIISITAQNGRKFFDITHP